MKHIFIFIAAIILLAPAASATEMAEKTADKAPCAASDSLCLLKDLEDIVPTITQPRWRDQLYREMAKLLTHQKQTGPAIELIDKIESPDTKAMTIRGIGMAAAAEKEQFSAGEYLELFARLGEAAKTISHPPSYAIALTYISMSQAMAGDAGGALETALSMENDALRNKAFAENAEIHAESDNIDEAMTSITHIDDEAFRDKAYQLIAKIFAREGKYDKSLRAMREIVNPYQRAQALLNIIAVQVTPAEVSLIKGRK